MRSVDPDLDDRVFQLLCAHFDAPPSGSRLTCATGNRTGLFGHRKQYRLALHHAGRRFRAFAKLVCPEDQAVCRSAYGEFAPTVYTEADNLKYLGARCPPLPQLPQLIGVAATGNCALYLYEAVERASNLSTMLTLLLIRRRSAVRTVIDLGGRILRAVHAWQTCCSTVQCRSLEPERRALQSTLAATSALHLPNLSEDRWGAKLDIPELATVRSGVIHADLGARNILIGDQHVTFVDWEAMLRKRLAVYDTCYVVTMLTLRCAQLGVTHHVNQRIHQELVDRAIDLETSSTERPDSRIQFSIGLLLSRVHLLARYGAELLHHPIRARLRRRRRQVEWLTRLLNQS